MPNNNLKIADILGSIEGKDEFKVDRENEKKISNETLNELTKDICRKLIGIIEHSENWRKFILKLILIVVFSTVLIGIPTGLYLLGEIYLEAYIKNPELKMLDPLGLVAILFTSWKIISVTLNKIVDNIFGIDKTLVKILLRLLNKEEMEFKSEKGLIKEEKDTDYIKISKPTSVKNVVCGILEYLKAVFEAVLK